MYMLSIIIEIIIFKNVLYIKFILFYVEIVICRINFFICRISW